MGDVFISYASEDKESAHRVATALAHHRHTVWWDRNIPPGRTYDQVIQEALAAAKCVIVLWSPSSIASDWVKVEADEAAKRRILVPALIADIAPPFEFRRIQAANLVDWDGALDHPELQKLIAAVAGVLGQPHAPQKLASTAPRGSRLRVAAWASAVAAIALGAAGGAWRLAGSGPTAQQEVRAEAPVASPHATATVLVIGPKPAPPTKESVASATESIASRTPAAAVATDGKIDLLAADNGGQLIVASHPDWARLIDGEDRNHAYVQGGEGVFAFKDERPATFDSIAILIPATDGENVKDFELLAGSDSPTGHFESVGTFTTQNIRFFKNPYQTFPFPSVRARYLKLKPLRAHSSSWLAIHEIRLYGRLD